MELDDELENFIRERKARVVQDKASLEQDPPYLEIKTKPHKAYSGSAVKENIPPKSTTQGKDESVGLPLGVEYEKKKHRLQRELRMDYRRYMAQNALEDSASIFPKRHSRLQRDAATMTEDSRFRESEDDEGFSSVLSRHQNRRGRPITLEEDEEEVELFQDELPEGRRRREIANEQMDEKSQTIRINIREKRENRGDLRRDGRRIRALSKNENADFATGLIIGAGDTDEALQRRKERYRQELQEQIAEQHRNKKKEKELELKVAATGANDPEKQPDRIKQFGLSRRRAPQDSEATGDLRSLSRLLSSNEKDTSRERDISFPPEQSHAAFQSPLLEYSSALGLGEGGLSPCGQPAAPFLPSSMDIPRNPLFVPHPPPSLSGVYRNPYIEPYQFCGTRNQPDPNMAYYGHPSAPSAAFPVSCWNVPPGTAAPNQSSNHSPHTEPPMTGVPHIRSSRPTNETTADLPAGSFPLVRPRSTKGRTLNYGEALKQQGASSRGSIDLYSKIQEQQQRKRVEQEENERYEAQLEVEMRTHQPWGKGGGGAPLRDSSGNLIADLNQMHKLNEEAYINPEQWQRRATAARMAHGPEPSDPNERVSGFTNIQTPQFARGNIFPNQPTEQQLKEQDQYKAFLKQQIEEKMRQKAEERERIRLEEEKEEKRLAEQRARIQREFEEEQEKKKRKEMEQKAKNEELIQLAEQRKREAEQKRREMEEKENAALRRQYERERERQAREEEVHREPLPPIPALQRKQGQHQHTPRPPTHDSQHSRAPLTQGSQSGLQSPPVPACRNQLRAAGAYKDVFSELSALRQQLRSEQKRLECRLQQDDWEELDSPMSIRSQERPAVDVFDMARLRLQAPVRRPSSRSVDPRNLRNHESYRLKHADGESRLGFCKEAKLEETNQRIRDYGDSYHHFSDQRSTVLDDYLDLSPPHQTNHLRGDSRGSERDSQLRSEITFIDDATPVPHTPKLDEVHQLSARERRRLSKQHAQERAVSSQLSGRRNDGSSHSGYRPQREAEEGGEWRIRNTAGRLTAISRRGNADGPTSNSAGLNIQ
ncbi:centrosome and spindle pole-associated protein 1 isoform X3 [Oryzias melastigma]|uniref:centrosome and spindle pole-associated protein 1 isoform X3 n=1 Tax=Oryzias melastigma TaxID=30732 RepID=UPI000CF7BCF5|nr:centrosome and spindle pole-associated protein 1 isoform X3 [Oryzias melastigma]